MTPTDIEKLKELARDFKSRPNETASNNSVSGFAASVLAALEAKDAEIERLKERADTFQKDSNYWFQRYEASEAALKEAREKAILDCISLASGVVAEFDQGTDLAALTGYKAAVSVEERIRALLRPLPTEKIENRPDGLGGEG